MSHVNILQCRPVSTGSTLRAFVTASFPSGLTIADITVHQNGDSSYALPPSKPQISGMSVVPDPSKPNRPKYVPVVSFADPKVRKRWSEAVVDAVRSQHPEVFSGG